MSIVTPFRKHLEYIKYNLETIATDIVVQNTDFIIGILVDRQIHRGINSQGRSLGTYSPKTQKYLDDPMNDRSIGDRMGDRSRRYSDPDMPKTGRYNLDWFGNYIESIYLINEKGGFNIWSRDWKAQILQNKYGGEGKILKLTDEHNDFINMEIILPGLRKYLLHNLLRVGKQPETIEYIQYKGSSLDF